MQRSENNEKGLLSTAESEGGLMANSCISRLVRPLFKAIDRPYKLYPVGILFGLGFDTASEMYTLSPSLPLSLSHSLTLNILTALFSEFQPSHERPAAPSILISLLHKSSSSRFSLPPE